MAYSTDVEAAKALATRTHEGQTDKAGLPYITHPERVAGRLDTPEEQVVGWLHDTVEDTEVTLSTIESQFGPETTAAVDAISRREAKPGRSTSTVYKRTLSPGLSKSAI